MSSRSRVVTWAAVAYPIALIVIWLALRWVGERWWVTGIVLYLPRVAFGAPLPILLLLIARARHHSLLWTQAVAALVLLGPLMGFVASLPPPGGGAGPLIRVLSYNVESGRNAGSYDGVVAEIDRYSPDIVFLEEAGFAEKLIPLMQSRYPTVVGENQFVIASRYPIVTTTEPDKIPLLGKTHSPRYLRVVFDTPLGRIVGYPVHPISPREALNNARGLRHGILTGRAAAIFYENSGLRELQTAAFSRAAASEADPVILAGDTNLPDSSIVLNEYLRDLTDGFSSAGWGFGYTFPTDKLAPWMRIDRIFASHQLRFVKFQVGQSTASDHRCVVADIALRR